MVNDVKTRAKATEARSVKLTTTAILSSTNRLILIFVTFKRAIFMA